MKCSSGFWSCSLFAFFSITYAVTVEPLDLNTCNIQAWVRAPDLEPGEIIPGQVKVQTNGFCNPISEYSLVLRFKERIWAKIPKPGVILPERPQPQSNSGYNNLSADEWRVEWNSVLKVDSFLSRYSFGLSWGEYAKQMKDTSLWEIAEEERIAFETRYKLSDGLIIPSKTQSIHDFALLVPTTNYPPSIANDHNIMYSSTNDHQAERGHEHIYLYTVEVKFNNGSTIEVPAGLSSFNTVSPNPQILDSETPGIVSFTANFTQTTSMNLENLENPLNISSNIEITLPHGGHVEQGSILNLTFTSSELQGIPDADRANHTILLSSPFLILQVESQHHVEMLFPDLNIPAEIRSAARLRCHGVATSNDSERSSLCYNDDFNFTGDKDQKPDWSISTSVPLKLPKVILPSFDMYYQSIEAKIWVTLALRYILTQDLLNTNNENDPWIPTMQTPPVKNSKHFQSFSKDIPLIIHSRTRKPDFQITHYLSPDARQPIFVDPCTADKLSRLSFKERDRLAPTSTPIIKKNTDQVVRNRYYSHSLHYVGDTWQRKVLDRGLNIDVGENSQCGFSTRAQAQTKFMV